MEQEDTPERKEQLRVARERYIAKHGREKLRAAAKVYNARCREELRRLRVLAGRT